MRFRDDSPEPGGYSTVKAAGKTKPRLPDVMSRSIISFDPSIPPAAFPSKLHVSPEGPFSSNANLKVTSQAVSNMPDREGTVTKDGKKRKREREDRNSGAAVGEVQEGDFAVVIDWTASNGHQNPVWKANVEGLTNKKNLPYYEKDSESYEDILARNEVEIDQATDEDEVRIHHRRRFKTLLTGSTGNRCDDTME